MNIFAPKSVKRVVTKAKSQYHLKSLAIFLLSLFMLSAVAPEIAEHMDVVDIELCDSDSCEKECDKEEVDDKEPKWLDERGAMRDSELSKGFESSERFHVLMLHHCSEVLTPPPEVLS